jgi:hypothetical protein
MTGSNTATCGICWTASSISSRRMAALMRQAYQLLSLALLQMRWHTASKGKQKPAHFEDGEEAVLTNALSEQGGLELTATQASEEIIEINAVAWPRRRRTRPQRTNRSTDARGPRDSCNVPRKRASAGPRRMRSDVVRTSGVNGLRRRPRYPAQSSGGGRAGSPSQQSSEGQMIGRILPQLRTTG